MAKYVSRFTGQEIDQRLADVEEKWGAAHFNPMRMEWIGFKNEEDKAEWVATGDDSLIVGSPVPFSFSGTVNQVRVVNEMSSKDLYFTTQSTEVLLTCSFISQEKGITDSMWNDVNEDFEVTVSVDKGSAGTFVDIITGKTILNGNLFTFDVGKYLATGANRVRVQARGLLTGYKGSFTYSVTLTTMYIAPSKFAWNNVFIESPTPYSYSLGGLNIGGSLEKKLKVKVTNTDETKPYSEVYEDNIGTLTATTNAYFFKKLVFPKTGTGVYHVEIWLDANGLESDHLHYNIMCVSLADVNTAQLVCINDIATDVTNGSDAPAIVKYAVYNGKESLASPYFEITKDGRTLSSGTEIDISVQSKQNLSASIDTESEEASFEIQAMIQLGDSSQTATITIDNSKSFPAVKGAVFYMNAVNRTNSQENKDKIVNEVDGREYNITVTNIAYADGTDGHTVDVNENGRKCMLIPATCLMNIGYRPMAQVSEEDGEDVGWTFELLYKVANAADYNENIITISPNPTDAKFQGLVIKPKNVCLHSRDLNSNDLAQSYNTKDNEIIHLAITIVKGYKTNYGNIAQIYVNGVKKTSFAFESTDSFSVPSNIIMGSQTADLYVYKMRIYNQSFGWQDVIQNFINCLPSQEEKFAALEQIKSVTDDSYNISYDAVVGKRNTMVIEMKDGAILPNLLNPKGGKCNVTFNFPDVIDSEMDEDFKQFFSGNPIEDETIEGQGTTAMTYFRWNFRWKFSSTYNKRRITAKKNVASSMHSHKMGATRMYNNLHRVVCGANEVGKRVAVYQYPAYGFLKTLKDGTTDQYNYTFIGLYTVGPDKGDKPTFGYDNKTYKNSLIHLEGTDHNQMAVGYDYPWDATRYSSSREAMGVITDKGDVAAAWEVGAAGKWETGLYQEYEGGPTISDETEVQNMLDAEFKPAYNVIYNNSTSILGVSETLDQINSNPTTWRESYSELEFYTDGVYDLYYYNEQEKVFKPNGINLLTDLGITKDSVIGDDIASRTEFFKEERRKRFKKNFHTLWDLDDALFHDVFCEIIGASDNFKKNNYPYKFALLANGGKWRKRQDDLDTIFDINNQGFAAKEYSILLGDKTSTGSGSIYRGENSNLTILLSECYAEEKKNMAHRIFDAMASLSPYGQFDIERLVGYVQYCCWDRAQYYFTKGAYNSDAEWTYEEAWPLHTAGIYKNDVNPLAQSQGDHMEAEKDWVELRMVFMTSYYNWGTFSVDKGDDKSTGQISFRAAGGKTYTIIPALDHNPTILVGQSDIATAGKRVKAGEEVEVTVPDMGNNDTHVYIQGADYLADLGDLKDLQVSADNPNFGVASKRLRRLKLGGETGVTSNIRILTLGNCPSMEEVNAQNLSWLSETVNLSQCPRLKKALFSGTQVANVIIASGSKIIQLSLPGTLTTLSLVKLLNLTEENLIFDNLSNIAYLRLENNAHMDGWEMLKNAYANSDKLANIRVVGFDHVGDSSDIDMIASFVTTLNEAGYRKYNGINANGGNTTDLPVLDGKLVVNTPVYGDTLAIVEQNYPHLNITAPKLYVRFADSEVLRVLIDNKVGDGTGIMQEHVLSLTSISSWFVGNTIIKTFDEFKEFVNFIELGHSNASWRWAFSGCTNLQSIILPPYLTKFHNGSAGYGGVGVFYGCKSLQYVGGLERIKEIGSYAFYNCTSLAFEDLQLPNLTSLGQNAFYGVKIKKISDLGKITALPTASSSTQNFGDKNILEELVLPQTITKLNDPYIGRYSNCVIKGLYLPLCTSMTGYGGFSGCKLEGDINLPALEGQIGTNHTGNGYFQGTNITSVSSLGNATSLQTGYNTNGAGTFAKCANLKSVVLPQTMKVIGALSFYQCASLDTINIDHVEIFSVHAFVGCSSLHIDASSLSNMVSVYKGTFANVDVYGTLHAEKLTTLNGLDYDQGGFQGTNIEKITSLGQITKIPNGYNSNYGWFMGCKKLKLVILPTTLTILGNYAFAKCVTMEAVILQTETPPELGTYVFSGTDECLIYVPDGSVEQEVDNGDGTTSIITKTIVELYKEASGWSDYADRIWPISQLATDKPSLYEEISEYL